MAEEKILPLCPRCGAPYRSLEYKVVNGRKYLYAYHGKAGRNHCSATSVPLTFTSTLSRFYLLI